MDGNMNGFLFGKPKSVKGTIIKASPNGRYFTDQNGIPFFYLADTAWTLFKRLDREEMELYFQDRAAKGFTVIQAYFLRGLRVKNLYGQLPLVGRDPAKPNEAFYENIDYAVDRANELGLVIAGVVTWGAHVTKNDADEEIFDEGNAYVHGKFLGDRYKDNCVIWYLGGDRSPEAKKAVWSSMARGLKDGSGGRHLVSYHGPGRTSSSQWFHNEEWLDFNAWQTGHLWTVNNYDFIAADYALRPAKPVLDMESSYENIPTLDNPQLRVDSHQIRESMYWQMLAGAAGHGYGCNDIWCFCTENALSDWQDYCFPFRRLMPNTHWRVALDSPGARCVGIARKLFELRPWYKLIPDNTVIVLGQGEGQRHIQAAVADDGSFLLAYLPMGGSVGIQMDSLSGGCVKAQWYNPRDGRFIPIGEYANAGVREFVSISSYDRDDWVLVLEDAEKNLPNEL